MTAPLTAPPLDLPVEQIPFSRLVLVELRKSVNTLSGMWLLITIATLVSFTEVALMLITLVNDLDVAFNDFTGVAAFLTSILLPVFGILLVTSEWGQRSAMVSFSLEPRRGLVIAAKWVAGLLLTLATVAGAMLIGLACTLVCDLIQPETTTWDISTEVTIGFLIGQTVAMTGGFALACLFLNTPAAIVVFFVYQWVLPIILIALGALVHQLEDIGPWINLQVALEPVASLDVETGEEVAQFLVSGSIWLGIPLILGLWRILHAEVK